MSVRKRLGEELIAAGILTPAKLEAALQLQRAQGGYLSDLLVMNGFVEESVLLAQLASKASRRFLTSQRLSKLSPGKEALAVIALEDADRLCVMALDFDAKSSTLRVAVPEMEEPYLSWVRAAAPGAKQVVPMMAVRAAIRAAIARNYRGDVYAFSALLQLSIPAKIGVPERASVVARARRPSLTSLDADEVKTQSGRFEEGGTEPFVVVPTNLLDELSDARQKAALAEQSRKVQLLQVANSLGAHLARERDLAVLLHRLLAFACDTLPVDEGVVLWASDGGELEPRAVRSKGGNPVVVSSTLIQEVRQTEQAVLTANVAMDPRFNRAKSVLAAGLHSAMGVPLLVFGKVQGMLCLSTRGRGEQLGPTDLTLLSGIAAQASTSIENAVLNQRLQADATTRAHLARFFSPALVELASSGALTIGQRGEAQQATILFADIRAFTSLSERLSPEEVVELLNEHFEAMVEIVFSNGGTLDKFIGDALMALWGVPLRQPDEPVRAIKAAREMVARVEEMNKKRAARGAQCFSIGVGINTGPVVFGAIGASRRLELTAIGDAVNVAARLSQLAAPRAVLVSSSTSKPSEAHFRMKPMTPASLKGRSHPVACFEVGEELVKSG